MGRNQTKTCNVCFKTMRSDNLKRHMMRRDHLTEHETKDSIVTKGLHDGEIWNNSCKCEYCEWNRQSEGGEDHLTEEENDDCCITLGERLHMAAKMVFLYPELLSPSPHYPEWLNTWIEGQTEMKSESEMADNDNCSENKCKCKYCEEDSQSEDGDDQSETSDESGEDDNSDNESIYRIDVDVENRDDDDDIYFE